VINPFQSFFVQPSFGKQRSILKWSLLPGYENGDIYVYRSPTGLPFSPDWELLNEDHPVRNVDFYEDTYLLDTSKFRQWHYRLLLEHTSGEYDSPIMGMFSEQFTRSQYGLLYKMRRMEALRMRHNGVPVMHCIPSRNGERSDAYNPYAGSVGGWECLAPDSFGTWFQNGFKTIVQTRAELLQVGPQNKQTLEGGGAQVEQQQFKIRLLGFPVPEVGHIIVLPFSDARYVITGNVVPFLLRGFLPVAYEVDAELLNRSDALYKIPLPIVLNDIPKEIYVSPHENLTLPTPPPPDPDPDPDPDPIDPELVEFAVWLNNSPVLLNGDDVILSS
jgi:hypothetical protein